ncbi:hypothetical protein [Sorangium sp. So ce1024]|uniref:hypothetical protein n=1 Tax=Sorangium sp. So ce1024 TaxID=3133327 RepID=UPI003F00CE70
MFWAEAAGRVLAMGDAAPVAEVVAHWVGLGVEVTVYAGESLPGRRVDRLERAENGSLRRAAGEPVADAAWAEAIEAASAAG